MLLPVVGVVVVVPVACTFIDIHTSGVEADFEVEAEAGNSTGKVKCNDVQPARGNNVLVCVCRHTLAH